MRKLEPGDPETLSADPVAANVDRLKELFPEVITERKIDFEVLKQLLGGEVEDREERYGLNWHGKRRARQLALTPSTGTLRPCPEESVDWETTKNLFIEGDNLEVLKLLQKSYAGKVKLIYIDPPYNTGKDFVYPDDYRDSLRNYLELTGQAEEGRKLTTNLESSGRFHTAWLNMMYPRLKAARELLRPDGIVMVSIDDGEQPRLAMVLDEIFGAENYLATFVWKRKAGGGDDSDHVAAEHEYIVSYAKDETRCELASILHESPSMTAKYNREEGGRRYYLERLDKTSLTYNKSMDFEIECPDGTSIRPPQPNPRQPSTIWRWGRDKVQVSRGELEFERDKRTGEWRVYTRTWEPTDGVTPRTLLIEKEHGRNRDGTQEIAQVLGPKVFSNPKPLRLLRHLLSIAARDSESIVLDFFAGSGTTAHALMEMNAQDSGHRRYILVQLPEPLREDVPNERHGYAFCESIGRPPTVAELTKERLRRISTSEGANDELLCSDRGFRAFRLDSSNIREWNGEAPKFEEELQASIENLKVDRNEADVLCEVLLKLGLDLCVPIERRTFSGKEVHSVGGGVLMACLAPKIATAEVEEIGQGIARWREELKVAGETTCVFRDSAFEDDVAKTNLVAILVQSGIDEKFIRSL